MNVTMPTVLATGPIHDADLIAAAKDIYRQRNDHLSGGAQRWQALEANYPTLALSAVPKPNRGIGSGPTMVQGKCWLGEDKRRQYRSPAGTRRRPSSEMTMEDGSPLRHLLDDEALLVYEVATPVDVDDADAAIELGEEDYDYLAEGEHVDYGDDEKLGASFLLDGIHGEHVEKESIGNSPHLLEHCALCSWPLALKWIEPRCEFPTSPMPEGRHCHCNGCLSTPHRARGGRPRYCSDDCANRMDNAFDRAHRRREGAKSRKSDPEADRLANYRVDIAERVRATRSAPPIDWSGIWAVPPWMLDKQDRHQLNQSSPCVWQISPLVG